MSTFRRRENSIPSIYTDYKWAKRIIWLNIDWIRRNPSIRTAIQWTVNKRSYQKAWSSGWKKFRPDGVPKLFAVIRYRRLFLSCVRIMCLTVWIYCTSICRYPFIVEGGEGALQSSKRFFCFFWLIVIGCAWTSPLGVTIFTRTVRKRKILCYN